MADVALTVDLEQDCPPHLGGWRGMREGGPRLLELLADEGVPATFFCTARAAEEHPGLVDDLVASGHELGCHGVDHRSFMEMTCREADDEIARSAAVLREAAPVTAFRAPYLSLPEAFLPLLEDRGFRLDASRARYKPGHWLRPPARSPLRRLTASTTSSVLRLPAPLRDPLLRRLRPPVVLFVHPWELVDLTGEPIPLDCRFATGRPALRALREVVALFRARGDRFVTATQAAPSAAGGEAAEA